MAEEKGKGEEKKDEGKIIMETKMSCADCRYEVYKTVVGYPGVQDVTISLKENKVTLKAPKVDAKKLFEYAKKKSKGKIVKLVYPDPSQVKKKEEPKKEEKKPVEVTVVLKITGMDCSSCIQKVEKAAWNIKDVQSVKVAEDTLTVKGLDLDPKKVCGQIIKISGKYAEVVPPKKKEDEKKGDEKKDGSTKKDEKQAPQMVLPHVYPPQYFSDENPNACNIM